MDGEPPAWSLTPTPSAMGMVVVVEVGGTVGAGWGTGALVTVVGRGGTVDDGAAGGPAAGCTA